jgi:hypothetical protein
MGKTLDEKMRDMHQKALKKHETEVVEMAKNLYKEITWANDKFFDRIEMPVYELAEKIGGDVPSLSRNLLFSLSSFLRDNPYPNYPLEFEETIKLTVKLEKALKAYDADLMLKD